MSQGNWICFELKVPDEIQEIVISELAELGFDGFEQEDNRIKAYIEEHLLDDVTREQVQIGLHAMGHGCDMISEHLHEPRNWNEEWEKTIEPMQVGRFWVHPSWTSETCPEGLIPLMVDPKQAFGTGYHETTRLILRLLPYVVKEGDTIVDVGTGTGILAIAGLKLGASHAFGFDIDEWSYDNAIETMWLNGVQDKMQVKIGSFETVPEWSTYSIVLANVIRDMLLTYAKEIVALIKPGGHLVLSGLMIPDEAPILAHPVYAGLKHIETTYENDWCAIHLVKG